VTSAFFGGVRIWRANETFRVYSHSTHACVAWLSWSMVSAAAAGRPSPPPPPPPQEPAARAPPSNAAPLGHPPAHATRDSSRATSRRTAPAARRRSCGSRSARSRARSPRYAELRITGIMRSLKLCGASGPIWPWTCTWTFSEPEWLRIIASPSAALPPGLCGGPDLVIASHRLSVSARGPPECPPPTAPQSPPGTGLCEAAGDAPARVLRVLLVLLEVLHIIPDSA
jgi:hypothetical protein